MAPRPKNDAFFDLCLFVFFVASFTFYLAGSDDLEATPRTGSDDNVISFVYLDPSDTQFSGMEPEDELGTLTVSGITPEGFDLSWKLKDHTVYDSFAVECKDTQHLWDVREVQLPGDVTGSRIQGLRPLTEYQIKLYGITTSQRSALLEAVAVTGIILSLRNRDARSEYLYNIFKLPLVVLSILIYARNFKPNFREYQISPVIQ